MIGYERIGQVAVLRYQAGKLLAAIQDLAPAGPGLAAEGQRRVQPWIKAQADLEQAYRALLELESSLSRTNGAEGRGSGPLGHYARKDPGREAVAASVSP